jgi:hypothetical protein
MSKMSGWLKGLLGLLLLVAFGLALAWLLRLGGQGSLAGQEAGLVETRTLEQGELTGTALIEKSPMPVTAVVLTATAALTSTAPAEESPVPTATVVPTASVAPPVTPAEPGVMRILYAVQPPGKVVTLWTLDYDPATGATAPHELTTSPYESAAYLRVYEITVSPNGQYVALNLQNAQTGFEYAVWTARTDGVWLSQLMSLERFQTPVFLDWIPDSRRMLLRGDYIIVDTMDVEDKGLYTLLSFRASDLTVADSGIGGAVKGAAISPDGHSVAFSVDPGNMIWIVALNENRLDISDMAKFSSPTQGQGGGGAYDMAWSPNQEKIAYFDTFVTVNNKA